MKQALLCYVLSVIAGVLVVMIAVPIGDPFGQLFIGIVLAVLLLMPLIWRPISSQCSRGLSDAATSASPFVRRTTQLFASLGIVVVAALLVGELLSAVLGSGGPEEGQIVITAIVVSGWAYLILHLTAQRA